MIRKFEADDLEAVMQIWLETNTSAHDYISADYWQGNYEAVKKMLPDAEVFVYEEHNTILGFIGLMENYIAGIFVDGDAQSKGIGKALLDYVKKSYAALSLQVYKKNTRAVSFYVREDFTVLSEQIDLATSEAELIMNWTK